MIVFRLVCCQAGSALAKFVASFKGVAADLGRNLLTQVGDLDLLAESSQVTVADLDRTLQSYTNMTGSR